MTRSRAVERLQREHYDRIADRYQQHYGDRWSLAYRRRFINAPMLGDVDLAGQQVLDALCGNGETTGYLVERGARVTGLDISAEELSHFRERWPQCRAHCASIFDSGLPDESFDGVVVVGGLHHLHPHLSDAVAEIHRLLRPAGWFTFMEPHQGSLADRVRRIWYRRDPMFADNEEAIDLDALHREFADRFRFEVEDYGGSVAFLAVLNSLILRVPLALKRLYSPIAMAMENVIRPLQGRRTSCFVIGRWRKRERGADVAAS